ncbi:MAG: MATE family efflux transporter [Clostridia bacterium]|nr:MATE family efflux transporter [Clostridia bacterium]
MIAKKCPCCGASVEVDAETNSVCKFCGATLFDETAVTAQALQPKNTTNTQNENINDNDIVEENNNNDSSKKNKHKKFFDKSLFTLKDGLGELNLFKLAIPHFLDLFFISTLALISTIVINRFIPGGAVAVEAANRLINIIIVITNLICTGANILISIYMGREDLETVRKLCYINIVFTIIINVLLSVIIFIFAEPFLNLVNSNSTPEEIRTGLVYLRVRVCFLSMNSLSTCLLGMLRCFGDNKPTLISGIIQTIVSTGLNFLALTQKTQTAKLYWVSFAPVIATFVGLSISYICWKLKRFKLTCKIDFKLLGKLLKVGAPGGVSNLSYTLSQLITTAFVFALPLPYKNARVYLNQILYMVYHFGYALGNANAIMVGRRCGAGDLETADKMHKQNIFIAVISNAVFFTLVFACKDLIFKVFSPDAETMKIITIVLAIDFFVEIGRAFNHMGEFGLNGVGDVYATTIISVSGCWLISVLLAYIFGVLLDMKLVGIWLAFAIDEIVRGMLYLIRWCSGRWKKKFIEKRI